MELVDFARLGSEIAEKSLVLKAKREEAVGILKEIKAIEDDLRPLVIQHSKMISEMLGSVTPPPPPLPAPVYTQPQALPNGPPPQYMPPSMNVGAPLPPNLNGSQAVKARIRNYISKSSDREADTSKGISATSVAEALNVEASLVREVLMEMYRGR